MANSAGSNQTALVTGGCGFLGSHLTESLLKRGFRVVAVDNFCTGSRSNKTYLESLPQAAHNLRIVEADVCRPWKEWVPTDFTGKKAQWVFHFASPASPPHYQALGLETMWVNSRGLAESLAAADSLGARVVFSSTSEIYGDPAVTPQPESYRGNVNTWGPRACYDEAKRFGESLIYTHNLKYGTAHGAVRIFNTYGPRMNPADGRVVINLLLQALKGEALTVYGSGKQTRSFCYVDDLIAGILAFAASSHSGPMNIGNEREFTILELADKVQALFPGKKLEIQFKDLPKDDPTQRRPDISLAKKTLGWQPHLDLESGLTRMLAWLKETVK